jgi:hypothetical protein
MSENSTLIQSPNPQPTQNSGSSTEPCRNPNSVPAYVPVQGQGRDYVSKGAGTGKS